MLLGSSTSLPNSVMSHLFSMLCTGFQLKKRNDLKLASFCFKSLNGFAPVYVPLRSSSPLHSFSAAPFFCRYLSIQNTILSHKVKWLALFLLLSSNNVEQSPHFYPSCILCQFLQIFPENLSLFKNFFYVLCTCIYNKTLFSCHQHLLGHSEALASVSFIVYFERKVSRFE